MNADAQRVLADYGYDPEIMNVEDPDPETWPTTATRVWFLGLDPGAQHRVLLQIRADFAIPVTERARVWHEANNNTGKTWNYIVDHGTDAERLAALNTMFAIYDADIGIAHAFVKNELAECFYAPFYFTGTHELTRMLYHRLLAHDHALKTTSGA